MHERAGIFFCVGIYRIYGNYTVFSVQMIAVYTVCTVALMLAGVHLKYRDQTHICGTSSNQLSLSRNRSCDHSGTKMAASRALHPYTRLTCGLSSKNSIYIKYFLCEKGLRSKLLDYFCMGGSKIAREGTMNSGFAYTVRVPYIRKIYGFKKKTVYTVFRICQHSFKLVLGFPGIDLGSKHFST